MKSGGQMLIEVVVAVGVLALVLVGLTDLMTRSNSSVNYQKDREQAYARVVAHLNSYKDARDASGSAFFKMFQDKGVSSGSYSLDCYGIKFACTLHWSLNEEFGKAVSLLVRVVVTWQTNSQFQVSGEELLLNQ